MKKAILCVGNELRGDDAIGIELGKLIERAYSDYKVFYGYDTPEDEAYAIKAYEPDLVLIIDAAVGDDDSLEAEFMQNEAGIAFNTHTLPIHILARFIGEFCPKVLFLALFIKPENFAGIRQGLSAHGERILKAGFEKFKQLNSILNTKD